MHHSIEHTLNTEIASHKLVIDFRGSKDYISHMEVMLDETIYMGGRYDKKRSFNYPKMTKLKDSHYKDIFDAIDTYLGDLSC